MSKAILECRSSYARRKDGVVPAKEGRFNKFFVIKGLYHEDGVFYCSIIVRKA